MLLSAHVAVGAAVGLATRNPVLGFFAGLLSHHLIDTVPHTDIGSVGGELDNFRKIRNWQAVILSDILFALAIFLFIFFRSNFLPAVFWGAFGCIISDVVDNVPFWSLSLRKIFPFNYFHKFHDFFHYTISNRKYLWVGMLTQLSLIILSIIYVVLELP